MSRLPIARAARLLAWCRSWHTVAAMAWAVGVALAPAHAHAQSAPTVTERGVKAAFVYKFLGYVEWPASAFAQADSPVVVGVMGADDLAAELADAVRGRTVGTRAVEVRRLRPGEALTGLHALFVGASERGRLASIARPALGRGILVITESEDALDQGSVINLVVIDGRVRFEVSLEAAERAGLKLSSRMLAVAHLVRMGSN